MLRIAKLSLLLAPLFMVPFSGCATPRTASHSTAPVDTQQARLARLMAVAEQYEKEGKTDAAMRLYDHILAQQPGNSQAREHRDLLVEQGVQSGGRSLKPDTSTLQTPTALARKSTPKAAAEPSENLPRKQNLIAETPRKALNLSQLLAERNPAGQETEEIAAESLIEIVDAPRLSAEDQPLQDVKETPFPSPEVLAQHTPDQLESEKLPEQKPRDAAGVFGDAQWAATRDQSKWSPTSDRQAKAPDMPESLAAAQTPELMESSSKTVVSTAEGDGWIHVKPVKEETDLAKTEITPAKKDASPQPESTELASRSTATERPAEDWLTAVSPRSATPAASEFPAPLTEGKDLTEGKEPASAAGQPGTLVALCENLLPDLIPLVTQLESTDPAVRVKGLTELGEQQRQAQSASVAVYSLLTDADPLVAVHAAGTLRQVTGDAWSSVHTLARCLDHENPEIVQLSAYLLGQIGPEAMDAVPALEKVRDSSNNLTGLYAAEALTHITPADPHSVKKLTSALSQPDAELRWFAAVSLGAVAGNCEGQAVEALRKALQDQTPDVRVAACLSLGGLGSYAQEAIPDLKQAVLTDSPDVKSAAETALICLGG